MPKWGKCSSCLRPFVADETWKQLCILCWKRERGFDIAKSDIELGFALDRILDLESTLALTQTALARAKKVKPPKLPRPPMIPPLRVRQLILLCHPDRHGNSDSANDVTRWLLALRDKGNA